MALLGESLISRPTVSSTLAGSTCYPAFIDPHTHILGGAVSGIRFREDFTAELSRPRSADDFLINFCMQEPGTSFSDLRFLAREAGGGKTRWWMSASISPSEISPREVARTTLPGSLRRMTSYELFLAYKGRVMVDDETLFRTLLVAAESGALIMVHAENGHMIDVLVEQALADGRTRAALARGAAAPDRRRRGDAPRDQLYQISQSALYVVHVTCLEAIEAVARAHAAGRRVFAETCCPSTSSPTRLNLERPGFEGAKYVFTPPPRARGRPRGALRALARDVLSVVSSDHVPLTSTGVER